MRILWVVNQVLPRLSVHLDKEKSVFGGWVSVMIDNLAKEKDLEIGVVTTSDQDHGRYSIDNVVFYVIPFSGKGGRDALEEDVLNVLEDFRPDLLHIEGTELRYKHRFLELWKGRNVVSLQGVLNGYEPYEFGSLSIDGLMSTGNIQNIIFALSLLANKYFVFKHRLQYEREIIAGAQNLFGRTIWDRSHSFRYNTTAKYYDIPRTFREPFYHRVADRNMMINHSVFIGNSRSPRKGADIVIKAAALLKERYKDVKIFIAGERPNTKGWKDWKAKVGYPAYLLRLIRKLNLTDHVVFLGKLNADEMVNQMLKTHTYVMSSIIENSPNTLGEAMMLGLPVVCSYNGGIQSMAKDEDEVLYYRDNDPVMLSYQIHRIWSDIDLEKKLRENARLKALSSHNVEKNHQKLIRAYKEINE